MFFRLLVLHLCGWTNRLQGMSNDQQVVCAPGAWPCHALSLCNAQTLSHLPASV